ncbi:ABC-three component system protein [Hydrocarboniphaga effusa]|uniref:ABC-three component system protein n=1 Tax=Hydrocarboniphaga effusa TaxID=243629 RepID=UPI0035B4BF98
MAAFPSSYVANGAPIPKPLRVSIFSADQWESFVEEWASSLKDSYVKVARSGGAGDKGIDVACFVNDQMFAGAWDNYQCKRYDHPLAPSDVWIEIGKLVYYSFSGEYPLPRKYYFAGSKGVGTKLTRLLGKPNELKQQARENWDAECRAKIQPGTDIPLSGGLLSHFDAIDFSLFSSKTVVELIEQHSTTPFHAVRFGGGLPQRPVSVAPPAAIAPAESRYVEQILEAYGDEAGSVVDHDAVAGNSKWNSDFLRQRTRFYNAESLRNFSRDTVPPGTFEQLQQNVLDGVVDVCEGQHTDGRARMRATLAHAATLDLAGSPLVTVTQSGDKQGICHQLANADALMWVKKNAGE